MNIKYFIFWIYFIGFIYVTFFPTIPVGISGGTLFDIRNHINLIPFRFVYDDLLFIERGLIFQAFKQTFGNFVLLLPAGFLIPLIWGKIENYKKAFLYGFLISLSVEILQLMITFILRCYYRIFDVDDLILNTFGFVLGFWVYKFYINIFKSKFKK